MDEIRFVAGPIIQRYQDKLEAERQAILKAQEEAAAKKRAEAEAKKAAEDAKKGTPAAAEPKKQPDEDAEMKDVDAGEATIKPDSVEEPADEKK
jgi:heat shock 70kDa protein 4